MTKPSTDSERKPSKKPQNGSLKGPLLRWGLLGAVLVGLAAPTIFSDVGSAETQTEDGPPSNLLGDYLSGRLARDQHDIGTAAQYYSKALDRDPDNALLLEQSFLLDVAAGNWDRSVTLAKKLIKVDPTHRIARFLLGCDAFENGNYEAARVHFAAARQGPIADLASNLARAWVDGAEENPEAAFATLDGLSQADWAQFYQRYHRGLIADVDDKPEAAGKALAEAFERSPGTVRVADAYARHEVNNGNRDRAINIMKTAINRAGKHPISESLLKKLEDGETPPLLVQTPNDGLAEVFYGIGDALAGEGGLDMGVVFLQFAIHLKPDLDLAHVALAEAYDGAQKYDLELAALDKVPEDSPLWVNVQIQRAFALNALDQVDEAKEILEALIAESPDDIRPVDALGNIMRSHERYEEALPYYDKAIELAGDPKPENWTLYYSRGVCYERLKNWSKAEADLKQALELAPDESLILNYLGYTWVDHGTNLKQAMSYIRKAVKLKPEDGYYVDSLGWAYYRIGNLDAAVKHLERAVELQPDDPTINDHLGDVYWKVGRKLEAKYQWRQAIELGPTEVSVEDLKQKIAHGLEEEPNTKAAERTVDDGQTAR
ncbi:tetratricopeptide repeat protein [Methyloligella sp. 2.7D]|uniref:tetratricopeptide repeat protein n=1 Tax=unclassified Methyloligella TaxID=2625955 RepID=UPI00157CED8E|nr:tetratricopeptide repeat protein [Methyloligella sp. GL2]QKP78295.1 tetratricopeptide repeat protein [Methyloligella sp. GL2]